MRFSHDYSKLQDRVFTTLRAGHNYYEEDTVINIATPTRSFKAKVLLATIVSLNEISLPLLRYDTDSPGESREEIIAKIRRLYKGHAPPASGSWTLYLLENASQNGLFCDKSPGGKA